MKKLCVFCASSNTIDTQYYSRAKEILMPFIEEGFDLIYGGSDLGLMGLTAEIFHQHQRKVTSVMPRKLYELHGNPNYIDELKVVETMHERKLLLREEASCFLTLPGGFGTLEEVLEIITLKQLSYLDKPIVIADILAYYQPLKKVFDQCIDLSFAPQRMNTMYLFSDDPQEIITYVTSN